MLIRLFLMAFAVAGLIAPWNYAPAHDADPTNSTEIYDCDYAITTVSRSDYLICDDLEGYFADEGNKSRLRSHILNCPTIEGGTPTAESLRGDGIDGWWDYAKEFTLNKCRPWAAKRRTELEKDVGAQCKEEVRRAKAPDGCEAQDKEVRILYHQHREQTPCGEIESTVSDTWWSVVHTTVDCQ